MLADSLRWQPTSSLQALRKRAAVIKVIRDFFAQRNVLEVETPMLGHATVTDPHLHSLHLQQASEQVPLYLQTSPEYHMKRLLAAGVGSIFQIGKAFRADEQGRLHNLEFTLLEWYRPGFDHHDLMREMERLLQTVLDCGKTVRYSYQAIFERCLKINPLTAVVEDLTAIAVENGLHYSDSAKDKDTWLMFLFSRLVEPQLNELTFIYDFPASQAGLAKLKVSDPRVADRFEVYYQGVELANGFHELTNAVEQRQRFNNDSLIRKRLGYPKVKLDEKFLQALTHGLPDCAGVALGIDRLVMLALGVDSIEEVITFPTCYA